MATDFAANYNEFTNMVDFVQIDMETGTEMHRWELTANQARELAGQIEAHLMDNHREEWIAAMVEELDRGIPWI